MSNDKQKPEATLSDGNIKATLWKQDGPNGAFYTASFSKSYRDDQGHYQNGYSFTGTDLLKLSQLAQQAYQQSREMSYRDRRDAKEMEDKQKAPSQAPDRER